MTPRRMLMQPTLKLFTPLVHGAGGVASCFHGDVLSMSSITPKHNEMVKGIPILDAWKKMKLLVRIRDIDNRLMNESRIEPHVESILQLG